VLKQREHEITFWKKWKMHSAFRKLNQFILFSSYKSKIEIFIINCSCIKIFHRNKPAQNSERLWRKRDQLSLRGERGNITRSKKCPWRKNCAKCCEKGTKIRSFCKDAYLPHTLSHENIVMAVRDSAKVSRKTLP